MRELRPYHDPDTVRSVLSAIQLRKLEITKGLDDAESRRISDFERKLDELTGHEVFEIFLNHAPVFSRALVK